MNIYNHHCEAVSYSNEISVSCLLVALLFDRCLPTRYGEHLETERGSETRSWAGLTLPRGPAY